MGINRVHAPMSSLLPQTRSQLDGYDFLGRSYLDSFVTLLDSSLTFLNSSGTLVDSSGTLLDSSERVRTALHTLLDTPKQFWYAMESYSAFYARLLTTHMGLPRAHSNVQCYPNGLSRVFHPA